MQVMQAESLRLGKLRKLHYQNLDYLREVQQDKAMGQQQPSQSEDTELLYKISFFMGLTSGFLLAKFGDDKPE